MPDVARDQNRPQPTERAVGLQVRPPCGRWLRRASRRAHGTVRITLGVVDGDRYRWRPSSKAVPTSRRRSRRDRPADLAGEPPVPSCPTRERMRISSDRQSPRLIAPTASSRREIHAVVLERPGGAGRAPEPAQDHMPLEGVHPNGRRCGPRSGGVSLVRSVPIAEASRLALEDTDRFAAAAADGARAHVDARE